MNSNGRPRVLLLIPHLGGGGAERVTELLARNLSREKYDLRLAVMTQRSDGEARFGLPVHWVGARRVRASALPLVRLVRNLQPDLILSGMAHLNFLVLGLRSLFPRGTRVVIRQNSVASAAIEFGGLPVWTRTLYRLLYRRADRVICQTDAMAQDLIAEFGTAAERMIVLPNPVDVDAIRATMGGAPNAWSPMGEGPHLLAVGRLSREKGFDLLIKALAGVLAAFPGADVTLLGTGPEGAKLRALAGELGLQNAVRFAGHVADAAAYFPGAALFVLPSRYEGLPNALLEAAAGGLPIVAAPCSSGVTELLRGQPGVRLAREVSDVALAEILIEALGALRDGQRFRHKFVEAFRLDNAIPLYESLIDDVLDEAH